MKNKIVILALVLLSGLGYFAYQFYRVSSLQTIRATRGEIISSVYASGKTKAEKEAHLAFKSTGKIIYLPVKKNQEVKKWQIVATIDTSDVKANLDKDLQDYLKTRWDFDQALKDTYKDQALTDTIKRAKEKAQFDLNKSVTDVEIADRAIKNSSLYSPYDGIVTEVNGEINEWVSAFSTQSLVTITDPKTVYFSAELEEEEIGRIKIGQEALVTLDAYPGKKFEGTISEIERQTVVKDNGDTVLPIKVIFTDNDNLPLVGLNGDTQFVLERKKDVLVVPKRALKKNNGPSSITVKDGIRLKTVQIETGISDSKNIQVIKGVSETDQIILPGELE